MMYVIKHVTKGYYIGNDKYSKELRDVHNVLVVNIRSGSMLKAGEEFVEVKVVKTLVEV